MLSTMHLNLIFNFKYKSNLIDIVKSPNKHQGLSCQTSSSHDGKLVVSNLCGQPYYVHNRHTSIFLKIPKDLSKTCSKSVIVGSSCPSTYQCWIPHF